MNENNELWRAFHAEGRERRDAKERRLLERMDRLVREGRVQLLRRLDLYGYRIKGPAGVELDWWPRTGTWQTPRGDRRGRSWLGLAGALGLDRRRQG
jgi:hypothetical protein